MGLRRVQHNSENCRFLCENSSFLYQISVVGPRFVIIREISLFSRVFTGIYVDLEGLWLTPYRNLRNLNRLTKCSILAEIAVLCKGSTETNHYARRTRRWWPLRQGSIEDISQLEEDLEQGFEV